MDLLRKIGDKAKGSRIYLYRFNNTESPSAREPKNAKPCLMCQHVLKNAGVSRVHYIDDDNNMFILKNRDFITMIANPSSITKHFVDRNEDTENKFIPMNYVRA